MTMKSDIGGKSAMATPLDARIPPPILAVVTGMAMGGAALITPTLAAPPVFRVAGILVAGLVGAVFGLSAFVAFARAKTTINPVDVEAASSLVTTGIYGVSRNPMYVALTSLLVLLAFALSSAWLLLGPVLYIAFITRFQIIPEERAMRAKFGAQFYAYCGRVRRWL